MMTLAPDTIVELGDLLKEPDPPELRGRRGHRVTCEGHPNRLATMVIPMIVTATQWKYVDNEGEPDVRVVRRG